MTTTGVNGVHVLGGRYRLVERLGSGGMSVVWRAYDEVLGRQVAVKVLAGRYAADRASCDRIRAEAHAVALLSHPHVTAVFDYGESVDADGVRVPYVVMEALDGVTLARRLAQGPMPWRVALRVAAEVAAALAAAHARGLVHCDVTPGNVILTASGSKVLDFGIAAIAGDGGGPDSNGMLLGTPDYVAPERLAGGPVQPASDVYALGLLLYRMLTGTRPWQAETVTEILLAHRDAQPTPLPPIAGLPPGVAELCLRCLSKSPRRRPTSRQLARTLSETVGIRVPLVAGYEFGDLAVEPRFGAAPAPDWAERWPGRVHWAVAELVAPGTVPVTTVVSSAAVTDGAPAAGGAAVGGATRRSLLVDRRRSLRAILGGVG